ncbi:alkaline phosphatase D family protein [Flavobacteriaceae bacterium S356]|uniref:Alkaline phosphatase D family protein n=1 Tax=Asprobacillus argus TaxID=3076534 RepID=A0ABU3LER1_9FLAO|nr:alkaline phosphatase D family protein [Flavobacteriaceae bacterium S356]
MTLFLCVIFSVTCSKKLIPKKTTVSKSEFIVAFGSCNKQYQPNKLWKEIKKNKPDVWVWGGDNIYSDTDDMLKMKKDYEDLYLQKGYINLVQDIPVMATWDDHDYGLNDGGVEFEKKKEAQQLFLDFFGIPKRHSRRKQEGIYNSEVFNSKNGSVKVIVLDTRYFRTNLTKSAVKGKRYTPNRYGQGTILGETQWKWLEKELTNSKATFTVIVSSIQFLSSEHGFEAWSNFPHEVDRFTKLLSITKPNRVIILSGDRHISEFSRTELPGIPYPLVDFTSSGLTHAYSGFTSEKNSYRVKKVVSDISFGLLKFDFARKTVIMQMRGVNNILQQEYIQEYP